jgi:cytochrome c peroxidase
MLPHSAPSLVNVAYAAALTWADASVHTLESQMRRPLFNEAPVELGLRGREAALIAALEADAVDARAFADAFPGEPRPVSTDHLIKAIAAFERSLIFANSPFDRYVFGDDRDALSAQAKRGMALFFSQRSGCSGCHYGFNLSGEIVYEGRGNRQATYARTGLDPGEIRVPSLRNCAITAPYMHDGRLPSLEAVIAYYNLGGRRSIRSAKPLRIDPRLRPLGLGTQDSRDLVAFLQSLTDPIFIDNKSN